MVLGGAATFLIPSGNVPVVEAPAETEIGEGGEKIADEKYCNEFSPSSCPQECAVCPPCEICSSVQCRLKSSCEAIGFDENWYHQTVPPLEEPAKEPIVDDAIGGGQAPNAGMANPASVYCLDQGGKLEIREGEGGQYGVCILPDGRECDEWEFFRTQKCGVGGADNGAGAAPDDQVCGRENCHGLEIVCGPNPAEMCTMEYQLGDKCLRYVNCGVVDGKCWQIPNAAFDACKACAQNCEANFPNDPMKAFDCEARCE